MFIMVFNTPHFTKINHLIHANTEVQKTDFALSKNVRARLHETRSELFDANFISVSLSLTIVWKVAAVKSPCKLPWKRKDILKRFEI